MNILSRGITSRDVVFLCKAHIGVLLFCVNVSVDLDF